MSNTDELTKMIQDAKLKKQQYDDFNKSVYRIIEQEENSRKPNMKLYVRQIDSTVSCIFNAQFISEANAWRIEYENFPAPCQIEYSTNNVDWQEGRLNADGYVWL